LSSSTAPRTPALYHLSLHDALPIWSAQQPARTVQTLVVHSFADLSLASKNEKPRRRLRRVVTSLTARRAAPLVRAGPSGPVVPGTPTGIPPRASVDPA